MLVVVVHAKLSTLITACVPVHVDLTLNFSLNVIDLHGFLKDLDRIDIHGITRKAEDELHERRNAARIARQVSLYGYLCPTQVIWQN